MGGRDGQGVWDGHAHAAIKMENHQGPSVDTGYSAQGCVGARMGGGFARMDTCVRRAEALHGSPETITAPLIGSTTTLSKNLETKSKNSIKEQNKGKVYYY